MTASTSCIRFSTIGAVGWLEFNRPPVNAFSRQMVDETHDCIEAALADPKVRDAQLAASERVVEQLGGALERTLTALEPYLLQLRIEMGAANA